jgi:cytochrome c oxidase assembly factor CtaG
VAGRWAWRPEVLLPLALLAVLYARGGARLYAAGPGRHGAAAARGLAYLGGLVSLVLALCSPVEYLAELSFTAHMVQHQLLTMVAAPLLLLGDPFPRLVWGLPAALRRPLVAPLVPRGPLRRALRALTWMPAAGAIYTVTLWAWHHPVAYEAALRVPLLHDVEHLMFFGAAVLFWWPVINPAPRLRRLTGGAMYGARIGYVILATAQNTLLGAVLGLSERVLYPTYAAAPRLVADWGPVDDQAFGGGVMWSGSHMFLAAVLVLLHRALSGEGHRADARPGAVV